MTADEVKTAVLEEIGKIAPEARALTLVEGTLLREDLEIDSMDFLRFIVGLHERFGVEVPESDYGQLETLGDVVRYVARSLASKMTAR